MGKPERTRPSTFAERLAYARWVRLLTTAGGEESDTDLAARAGMSQPWVSRWKVSAEPPPGHKGIKGLAKALGCSDDWLVDGTGGEPPLMALWLDWIAARRGAPVESANPRYASTEGRFYTALELAAFIKMEVRASREHDASAGVEGVKRSGGSGARVPRR